MVGIGTLMVTVFLTLLIQLSLRGRAYGTNAADDVLPATPKKSMVELASRRGWLVEARWTERLGHTQTILLPSDSSTWQFTLESWNSTLPHAVYGHEPRDNEWRDPSITLAGGMVMIGPPETPEAIAFITGIASFFSTGPGRGLANRLHKLPAGLKHLPNPPGTQLPFTMLSDLDRAPDLPLEVVARHLRAWTAHRQYKDEHPVITWQPDGLTVRLIRSTLDPLLIEDLIDFANRLRSEL